MESEHRPAPVTTKILSGDEILQAVISFIENAATKPRFPYSSSESSSSFVYAITDKYKPMAAQVLLELVGQLTQEYPNFRARYTTDIQKENVEYVRSIIAAGVEVRHVEGNRLNFSISQHEFLNTYQPDDTESERISQSIVDGEVIWSNSPDLISQMKDVFERLWVSGVPAALRIRQIEQGIDPGETRILAGIEVPMELLASLFTEVRDEILVIVSPKWLVHEGAAMFSPLADIARERGVKVRVVTSSMSDTTSKTTQSKAMLSIMNSEHRSSSRPINTVVVIFDRNKMLMSQLSNESVTEFEKSPEDERISSIYTTNKQMIEGMASVFDALWQESELREREERSRKQAELLTDILTHDIRNRNQVAMVMGELLKDQLGTTSELSERFDTLLRAIESSTRLADNASMLGRLLPGGKRPTLTAVNLLESIQESLALVVKANSDNRVIRNGMTITSLPLRDKRDEAEARVVPPHVLADDLLNEVFINLYSNAVRYSRGREIELATSITEETMQKGGGGGDGNSDTCSFWKISIVDCGRGIPDVIKKIAFRRYLDGAEGSGLGLSIVHALVVERYFGRVSIQDRVAGDYSKGTRVDVWLQKAH